MTLAPRAVLQASGAAAARGDEATLALVLQTEGSTYVRRAALMLFGASEGQVGWLSGGCLEPELAARAVQASQQSRLDWIEIDTRDDEDLLLGSALGCRGRLRLVLLPLRSLSGWPTLIEAWYAQRQPLSLRLNHDGSVHAHAGEVSGAWRLASEAPPWARSESEWTVRFAPLPRVAVFGAGPETTMLLPLLRRLGWDTLLIERRTRWQACMTLADLALALTPRDALEREDVRAVAAALVMHHHFELDREALEALAASAIPFIGLLGPQRRREDLFKVLPPATREALAARLHSPIGLKLPGQGAEAIALSIAAQLQACLHGE